MSLPADGRCRVVIEDVRPRVDGGRFPVEARARRHGRSSKRTRSPTATTRSPAVLLHAHGTRTLGSRCRCARSATTRGARTSRLHDARHPSLHGHGLDRRVRVLAARLHAPLGACRRRGRAARRRRSRARGRAARRRRRRANRCSQSRPRSRASGALEERRLRALSLEALASSWRSTRTARSRRATTASSRSSSSGRSRASHRGTSSSRAPRAERAAERARHVRDGQARLEYVAGMGFDVLYLPPIHPIGATKRKGRNNALRRGARRSRLAVGHRRQPRAATRACIRSSARSRTSRAFAREAERLGIEIALDIAFQCSPDHPYVARASRVVHAAARRQRPVRGESAEEIRGHLPVRFRRATIGARCGASCATSSSSGSSQGVQRVPRRQSAHEAVRLLAMADRATCKSRHPGRDLPRRSVQRGRA